jgi:UDP-3-O-[3-hydroxymyristoyl] N-acetylglucosamine deacetylase
LSIKEKTIGSEISISGITLHRGENVTMVLHPLPENSGIIFKKGSVEIPLLPENVVNTQMATTIGKSGEVIYTVEHFMSAVSAMGITNLLIEIDGNEPPILDGSGAEFLKKIEEVGIVEQERSREILVIEREVSAKDGERFVSISPNPKGTFHIDSVIDFSSPVIGVQEFAIDVNLDTYKKELASARTFGFMKDFEYLKSNGFALGANYDNVIVVGEDSVLNEGGLRFENEFVRHKILDVIGDFSILGKGIIGSYRSFASSHALNHSLILEILSDKRNYSVRS